MPWANLSTVFVVAVVMVILLKVLKPLKWLSYVFSFAIWEFPMCMAANLDNFLKIQNTFCRMMVLKSEHHEWPNILFL